jgi:hypothetical protein
LQLLLVNLCELNNYGLFVNAFTGLLKSELMKKKSVLIEIITVVLLTNFLFITVLKAQIPQQFKYQAVLRDASGNIIASQAKTIVVDILKDSTNGPSVFNETHNTTTNAFGIINLNIGSVNTTDIACIDWASHTYFIKMTIGGVAMGTCQLLSVPYALHAKTAENGFSGNYNDLTNKPTLDGSETKINAGTNITISGSGTTASPYLINSKSFSHYIGELYRGGIVVAVWNIAGIEHGLVASLSDISTGIAWSNKSTSLIGTTAQNQTDGQANTNAIISQSGHMASAAKACHDYTSGGYNDWYLPALWELNQCYNAAFVVNTILGSLNGFQNGIYWSSSEFSYSDAMLLDFSTGGMLFEEKASIFRVRAIRRF